ncbi:MAG: carbohydrate-binding family 9-like protein [Victivallaceae bacterium]|nr:carbohydrate-binding family 9-like protein [Victivallaceae bacterium]
MKYYLASFLFFITFINIISGSEKPILVPAVSENFNLDGKLEEKFYRENPPYLLRSITGKNPAGQKTEVWICLNNNNLLIAFRCFEKNIAELRKTVTRKDGPVHEDDCVEFFLRPDADKSCYYHFVVNALNTTCDSVRNNTKVKVYSVNPADWNGVWASNVSITKDYWSVELRIPAAQFIWGRKAAMNLCRERMAGKLELSSLAELSKGSFHCPEDFIEIKFNHFTDAVILKEVSEITFYDNKENNVHIGIRNKDKNQKNLKVELQLYSAGSGDADIIKRNYCLKGKAEEFIDFKYKIKSRAKYKRYKLLLHINDDLLFFKANRLPHILNIIIAGNLFYSGELVPVTIKCKAPYPEKYRYKVYLTGGKNKIILNKDVKFENNKNLTIAIPRNIQGKHTVLVQLCDDGNGVVDRIESDIRIVELN